VARRRPGLLRPLLLLGAAGVLGAASRGRLHGPDEKARALIAGRRTDMLDRALPVLTDLGSMWATLGAAAALWAGGRNRLARGVLGAGAIAWSLAQAAKPAFARPRPYEAGEVDVLVVRPAGQSYPSGHPAVATAVCRVLEPEVPALRGVLRRIPRVVAFSRIYVGVHYPTDVIGGRLIGEAVADLWKRFAR
jgi:undecaprenyl-diphosphatase